MAAKSPAHLLPQTRQPCTHAPDRGQAEGAESWKEGGAEESGLRFLNSGGEGGGQTETAWPPLGTIQV